MRRGSKTTLCDEISEAENRQWRKKRTNENEAKRKEEKRASCKPSVTNNHRTAPAAGDEGKGVLKKTEECTQIRTDRRTNRDADGGQSPRQAAELAADCCLASKERDPRTGHDSHHWISMEAIFLISQKRSVRGGKGVSQKEKEKCNYNTLIRSQVRHRGVYHLVQFSSLCSLIRFWVASFSVSAALRQFRRGRCTSGSNSKEQGFTRLQTLRQCGFQVIKLTLIGFSGLRVVRKCTTSWRSAGTLSFQNWKRVQFKKSRPI